MKKKLEFSQLGTPNCRNTLSTAGCHRSFLSFLKALAMCSTYWPPFSWRASVLLYLYHFPFEVSSVASGSHKKLSLYSCRNRNHSLSQPLTGHWKEMMMLFSFCLQHYFLSLQIVFFSAIALKCFAILMLKTIQMPSSGVRHLSPSCLYISHGPESARFMDLFIRVHRFLLSWVNF